MQQNLAQIKSQTPKDEHSRTWQYQLRHAIRDVDTLSAALELSKEEQEASRYHMNRGLPLGITPHYLSLINKDDSADPLRRQVVPHSMEQVPDSEDNLDPLGEEGLEVVPFLVHRYPDRVLLLVTDRCASYCRFCTRKRMVGQGPTPTLDDLRQAIDYIRARSEIREVILSGGDALLLSDERLQLVLSELKMIQSVDRIRIATRMLTFAPMRVTPHLADILAAHGPIFILSHFNHVNEISKESKKAIEHLVNNGIPVLNQTVLLRGVNDSVDALSELFTTLVNLRAMPYYLHQCDLVTGTAHFRVPLDASLSLMQELRGHLSGLCIPTFVIDIPGGRGKVPLVPDPVVERTDSHVLLRGFKGEQALYPLG